jgi:predicted PurR-regulated permease PerM
VTSCMESTGKTAVPDGDVAAESPPAAAPDVRLRPMALFRYGVYASLGVLTVVAVAAALYTVRGVLIQALTALFAAISLDPAVRMLTRCGMRRGLAVLLIFLVALGLVAAFLVAVIPAVVHQFQAMVNDFPDYLARLQDRSAHFRQLSDRFHLTSQVEGLLASLPGRLGNGLLGLTGRLFSALFSTLTVVVLTIYFMADLPRLRRGMLRLLPRAHRAESGRIAGVIIDKVGAYMIGNILISLVAGVAAFIVLTVLGVPFSVPLALVVALCDLIPLIGATLGAVISVLVALLATDLLSICFVLLITGVGSLIIIYSAGYMRHDSGRPALLRVHGPVRGLDAAARAGRQLPGAVRRVGGRRPGIVPADRVLAVQEPGGGRGQEGVHRQPGR